MSVVLPVHAGIDPEHWRSALVSIADQTEPALEVIVIEDGPLTPAHDDVLAGFVDRGLPVVRLALPENRGAGAANAAGLAVARGDWIAKADADDISVPDRFARQRASLERSGADLCGAAMWEFDEDPRSPIALRGNPLEHEAIARRMRFNNSINHPTAMYRRETAQAVGGYPDWRYMQDYDLFARMLASGAVLTNLAEPLVYFRAGESMRRRRSARGFARREWVLQRALHGYGLVGRARMVSNFVIRMTFRSLPSPMLKLAYGRVVSSSVAANPSPERDA